MSSPSEDDFADDSTPTDEWEEFRGDDVDFIGLEELKEDRSCESTHDKQRLGNKGSDLYVSKTVVRAVLAQATSFTLQLDAFFAGRSSLPDQ